MRKLSYSFKLMAAAALALGLLLGSGAAQAATTVNFDPVVAGKAIGITELRIDGTLYDVEFLELLAAYEVYGELPGDFNSATKEWTEEAVDAVNFALNVEQDPVLLVGQEGGQNVSRNRVYAIGYQSVGFGDLAGVTVWEGRNSNSVWINSGETVHPYFGDAGDVRSWALFKVSAANQVLIGGSVNHLEGEGLVLQNNGGDDLPITGNVPFAFDTPLAPGDAYDVTVLTNPSNPDQQCSVARGSGTVSAEHVTNVVVSCVPFEPLAVVRVFVTSTDYDGNLGGLDGADAKCQEAADTAGLGGGPWKAWLSDNTGNAIDRIPNGRYRLLDDTQVADDKTDLTDGRLKAEIILTENGQELPASVWTGTEANGNGTCIEGQVYV